MRSSLHPNPLLQRLDGVHGRDHLLELAVHVLALGDLADGVEVRGQKQVELLVELLLHLGHPLRGEASGAHHERSAHESARLELLQDEPGLDGLSQTHLVGQQVANVVVGQGAVERVKLMRQRYEVARKRRQNALGHFVLDARELHHETQVILVIGDGVCHWAQDSLRGAVRFAGGRVQHAIRVDAPQHRMLDDAHRLLRRCVVCKVSDFQHGIAPNPRGSG